MGENAIVSYVMADDNPELPFFVHSSDGVIYNSEAFDADSQSKFTIKVFAENPGHKMPSLLANVIVSG